jgi:hypothetical protein
MANTRRRPVTGSKIDKIQALQERY